MSTGIYVACVSCKQGRCDKIGTENKFLSHTYKGFVRYLQQIDMTEFFILIMYLKCLITKYGIKIVQYVFIPSCLAFRSLESI